MIDPRDPYPCDRCGALFRRYTSGAPTLCRDCRNRPATEKEPESVLV